MATASTRTGTLTVHGCPLGSAQRLKAPYLPCGGLMRTEHTMLAKWSCICI